jgi:hypothetical protein
MLIYATPTTEAILHNFMAKLHKIAGEGFPDALARRTSQQEPLTLWPATCREAGYACRKSLEPSFLQT